MSNLEEKYLSPLGYSVDCTMVQPDDGKGVWNLVVQMDRQKESKRSQIFYSPSFPNVEPEIILDTHSWIGSFWVSPSKVVFATDSNGELWNNSTGTFIKEKIASHHIQKVWGLRDDAVYVLGERGTVLFFDGSSWYDISIDSSFRPLRIHGLDGTPLYLVGRNGLFFELKDRKWSQITIPASVSLRGVHLTKDREVFGCGEHGLCFRFSKNEFQIIASAGEDRDYSGIAVFKDVIYFGAGHLGVDSLNNGEISPFKSNIFANRISSSDNYLWTCGNNSIFRFDGVDWLKKDFL